MPALPTRNEGRNGVENVYVGPHSVSLKLPAHPDSLGRHHDNKADQPCAHREAHAQDDRPEEGFKAGFEVHGFGPRFAGFVGYMKAINSTQVWRSLRSIHWGMETRDKAVYFLAGIGAAVLFMVLCYFLWGLIQ